MLSWASISQTHFAIINSDPYSSAKNECLWLSNLISNDSPTDLRVLNTLNREHS